MRSFLFSVCAAVFVSVTGCGPQTTINTTPLDEAQKKAIREEDKRVADEEGGPQKVQKPGKAPKK